MFKDVKPWEHWAFASKERISSSFILVAFSARLAAMLDFNDKITKVIKEVKHKSIRISSSKTKISPKPKMIIIDGIINFKLLLIG
jgi:hypothetical protein